MISTQRTQSSSLRQDTPKISLRRYQSVTVKWFCLICKDGWIFCTQAIVMTRLIPVWSCFSAWLHDRGRWDFCRWQSGASNHRNHIHHHHHPEWSVRLALQLITYSTVTAADYSLPTQLQAGAAKDRSGGEGRPQAQTVRTGQQAEGDCTAGAPAEVRCCLFHFVSPVARENYDCTACT